MKTLQPHVVQVLLPLKKDYFFHRRLQGRCLYCLFYLTGSLHRMLCWLLLGWLHTNCHFEYVFYRMFFQNSELSASYVILQLQETCISSSPHHIKCYIKKTDFQETIQKVNLGRNVCGTCVLKSLRHKNIINIHSDGNIRDSRKRFLAHSSFQSDFYLMYLCCFGDGDPSS